MNPQEGENNVKPSHAGKAAIRFDQIMFSPLVSKVNPFPLADFATHGADP
jgi:hypothetical protein